MDIALNLETVKKTLTERVRLIAVSKTQQTDRIQEAYLAGHRIFGENKAQELASKYKSLPPDIEWHFIGHLQRNKVRLIVPLVHMIHSIDSMNLLREVNREASRCQRVIQCLLQFHIAKEASKFGLGMEEAVEMIESREYQEFRNIVISGVMGMASFTDDQSLIRHEYRTLHRYFSILKQRYFSGRSEFCELSMGMSGDYSIAVEEGSTMVRIGTLIFGERDTPPSNQMI